MATPNNIALLTQSHRAIAAKRRRKQDQVKEIIFDDEARREFLTGFHKRKVARTEAAKKKALERQKQERLEARNEQRRALRERAKENAALIEEAYGGAPDEDEWAGIHTSDDGQHQEDEYEGEEQLATVTVVEDFDLDSFKLHDKKPTHDDGKGLPPFSNHIAKKRGKTEEKKIRYQTHSARKQERLKQRVTWAERVEAGKRRKGNKKR